MRSILRAVPELYRRRGTTAGLIESMRLIFDVEPGIHEIAAERTWGGLGDKTRLGAVRLFGKSTAFVWEARRFVTHPSAVTEIPTPIHLPLKRIAFGCWCHQLDDGRPPNAFN